MHTTYVRRDGPLSPCSRGWYDYDCWRARSMAMCDARLHARFRVRFFFWFALFALRFTVVLQCPKFDSQSAMRNRINCSLLLYFLFQCKEILMEPWYVAFPGRFLLPNDLPCCWLLVSWQSFFRSFYSRTSFQIMSAFIKRFGEIISNLTASRWKYPGNNRA